MRTSATGKAERRRRAGFTLLELLVVVTLIGLMSAVVVLSLPDPRPSLDVESERFAARLLRAREEAVMTGRTVEVTVTPQGYSFFRRRAGERQALTDGPFGSELWEPGTRLDLAPGEVAAPVAFDPTGGTEAVEFRLQRDRANARVSVDGAGEVRVDAAAR